MSLPYYAQRAPDVKVGADGMMDMNRRSRK